ncbi:MAG: hypothetical protein H6Q23_626, partial [Bacteroidetes bacterium]|nr:hypothetical protein [Bacteroidota bacterium]
PYSVCEAQNTGNDSLFNRFYGFYQAGDLFKAEEMMLTVLKQETNSYEPYTFAANNNLGVVNQMLGKYEKALEYYNIAEQLVTGKDQYLNNLADIYTNKATILFLKKSYDLAVGYYEKSIRLYSNLNRNDKRILSSLASTYLNTGLVLLANKDFNKALDYFNRSLEIKDNNGFSGSELVYLNIAKAWMELKDPDRAEEYFKRSIERSVSQFNENHFRLAEVYIDYGLFLESEGRFAEALEAHHKALSISKNNYGNKHPLVSLAYKHIGDHFLKQADYNRAADYYQKSMIAVVNDFDDPDIKSNPDIDSVLFDIRLLDNLKSKSKALELLASEHNDQDQKLQTLRKSLETIELALRLTERISNSYLTEESRIYLSENEKETSVTAIGIAGALQALTGDRSLTEKMYTIAISEKAALLRNEIKENDFYLSSGIPDSLGKLRSNIASNIAACNKMIMDESMKAVPDNNKISLWKDAVFDMNRKMEKISDDITRNYPEYDDLLGKTDPPGLAEIQKKIDSDETILDYMISNQHADGHRDLYIFLITRKNLKCLKLNPDTSFSKYAQILNDYHYGYSPGTYTDQANALYYMYTNLIKPAEGYFAGKRLKIIPDEEIGWLPFDAFLVKEPDSDRRDWDGVKCLVHEYTISYSYSSSMLKYTGGRKSKTRNVFAFHPDYLDSAIYRGSASILPGAADEIESIYKFFRGKKFSGTQASETNFINVIREPVIFHLAMHGISDTVNSKYSYLLFDTHSDTISDGKLYNYEISVAEIRSPMVVLSACNSGKGTLYHGEGLMSLARGFTLAGASSVVRTVWEVNDETSALIMTRFYHYLSVGKQKDEALRLSKLDYLKEIPPAFAGPYYWAAYELMGNTTPVVNNRSILLWIISLIAGTGIIFYFLRRRRIFSDRSV